MHLFLQALAFVGLLSPVLAHGYKVTLDQGQEQLLAAYKSYNNGRKLETEDTIVVDCYVHFMKTADGVGATMDMLDAQMEHLNEQFAPYFRFEVKGTTETLDDDLARTNRLGTAKDNQMRNMLHTGTKRDLNIYLIDSLSLGWGTPPFLFNDQFGYPRFLDGVTIKYDSMPGGSGTHIYYETETDFVEIDTSEGDNLVHEVGIWPDMYVQFWQSELRWATF